MLAKKFALGFGIAIILPMLVHYGVSTFSPSPKWNDYYGPRNYEWNENTTEEAKARMKQEQDKKDADFRNAQKVFQQRLFIVAVPVGIAAVIIGAFLPIQAMGTGLMFGGIFTLTEGYIWYWSELEDWMRFLSLLIAFAILIYIGYRKLAK